MKILRSLAALFRYWTARPRHFCEWPSTDFARYGEQWVCPHCGQWWELEVYDDDSVIWGRSDR